MSQQQPNNQSKDKSLIWMPIFFVGIMVVGGFLIKYGHEGIKALGDALLIAGLLGLTVDQYAKKHLVKEAARDIDKYLLGYALPVEIQDTIREVRETRIVRRKWRAAHKILPLADEPNVIKLETDISFEAENITNRREWYTHEINLDQHTSPDIELLSCVSGDGLAAYSINHAAISAQVAAYLAANPHSARIIATGKKDVELQPKTRWAGKYEFRVRYTQIYPDIGSDDFKFDIPHIPTLGITIVVEHLPEFKIEFPSSVGVETAPLASGWLKTTWQDPKVFFYGEVIKIWWQRK